MGVTQITETRCLCTNLAYIVTEQFLYFEQPHKGCGPEQHIQMGGDESVNIRDITVVFYFNLTKIL